MFIDTYSLRCNLFGMAKVLVGAIPLCYSIFIQYFIQSLHNINISSIIHSFGNMFRFHYTIIRPAFIIRRYIQWAR